MKAKKVSIQNTAAIQRTLNKIKGKQGTARILHLGDSHVAADYITGMLRHKLQAKFGNAGRGFSHIDQPWGFGGRRLKRKDSAWKLRRVVDRGGPGKPYGFSGVSIEAKKKGAEAVYRVNPDDKHVVVTYGAQPGGGKITVKLEGEPLGTIDTAGSLQAKNQRFALPAITAAQRKRGRAPKGGRKLQLVASAKKVRLYGLSFEGEGSGVFYDTIGPVGADAKVYTQLEQRSFVDHLKAHNPDLIVLMVGGNDALKIRKKWTDLNKVKQDHEKLLDTLKSALPNAECLIWTPMDSGTKKGGKIKSQAWVPEVRQMQLEVAKAKGCAVWDLYDAMGGKGSIVRWAKAKVMNKDLIHPKRSSADLLGLMAYESLAEVLGVGR